MIKLKPHPDRVAKVHRVVLEWGPWARTVEHTVGSEGLVLITGKAIDPDGISNACNVTCHTQLLALFGAGEVLDGEETLGIRRGWELVNPAAEFESGPEDGSGQPTKSP